MRRHGPAVRARWLAATVRELQLAAGDIAEADPDAAYGTVMALRGRISEPRTPVERCLLEHFLHKARIASLPPQARLVVRALTSTAPEPAHTEQSSMVHVRRLLETRFVEPWTVGRLARRFGCHHRLLAKSFRSAYGISIHAFLIEQRVSAAIVLLASEQAKVDAVSALVGYRSKKNFYAEFRRVTGVTPARFRSRCACVVST
jgi:AraC-like DNA-binding protein